jgi:Photosynthesis system II assembly factor YCF48
MHMRLPALAMIAPLALLTVLAAGCGATTGSIQAGASSVSSASATAGTASATAPSGTAAPGTGTPGTGTTAAANPGSVTASCPPANTAGGTGGDLTGLQFVSPAQGWAVGRDSILATSDGGAHWRAQLAGDLNLTSVDFISGQDGWAVGMTSLLATTDGGARWTRLPEPCAVIRSVHFTSATTGFAVGGGRLPAGADAAGQALPVTGGIVMVTHDGGHTWQAMPAPAEAQTVCFSDADHGWLGADGLLYRSADGGRTWTALTSMTGQVGSAPADDPATMSVECASGGTAWALRVGPDAAMSQQPHVGYHADQSGATAIFAEQYFQNPGAGPASPAPGPYAGPFSALSSSAAVFVDWCDACGAGTAPWDVATGAGTVLTRKGNVSSITSPDAASFLTSQAGWVAGTVVQPNAGFTRSRSQSRIVGTTDGGRTWHVEYATPWTAWTS